MKKSLSLTIIFPAIVLIAGIFFYFSAGSTYQAEIDQTAIISDKTNLLPITDIKLIEPVDGFKERITKKPFGIFITPETSPVRPDKFTGYHTGVDAEFINNQEEIPVRAIADGAILVRAHAPGYGGVVVIKHIINGVSLIALYGHLDPASFLPANISEVQAGDRISILGDGYSEETDGARKHLHFAIYTDRGDEKIDFRGYVKTEEELATWFNPLDFY